MVFSSKLEESYVCDIDNVPKPPNGSATEHLAFQEEIALHAIPINDINLGEDELVHHLAVFRCKHYFYCPKDSRPECHFKVDFMFKNPFYHMPCQFHR